jgi:hypothetical protein
MQRLEVSCAVRHVYMSLGGKGLWKMHGEIFGKECKSASDKLCYGLYNVRCHSHSAHNVDILFHCLHTVFINARVVV